MVNHLFLAAVSVHRTYYYLNDFNDAEWLLNMLHPFFPHSRTISSWLNVLWEICCWCRCLSITVLQLKVFMIMHKTNLFF